MGDSPARKDIERLDLGAAVEQVMRRAREDGVHTYEAARRIISEGGVLTPSQCNELAASALSSLIAAMHREESRSG